MYDQPKGEQFHFIETTVEGEYVKLNFGGRISFLKVPFSEARKIAARINQLCDIGEDPMLGIAKQSNDALGKPGTVGIMMGLDDTGKKMVVKFTEPTSTLEFLYEQGMQFIAGMHSFLIRLK